MSFEAEKFEPLVSIIIPVYNVKDYLSRCLDSIAGQTYRNLDIILVDDGATDESGIICDSYAANDSRITVIHKENGGLSSAREAGVAYVKGEYAMFVDSDDWLDVTTVEKCVNAVNEFGVDCVFFSYIREYTGNSMATHIFKGSKLFLDDEADVIYRRFFGLYEKELAYPEKADSIATAWGKLYKTSYLKQGRHFDTKIVGTEDALLNIYTMVGCKSYYYLDEALYHYRKGAGKTLSTTYRKNLIKQWGCLFGEMEKVIDGYGLSEVHKVALENRVALSIVGIGRNELKNREGGLWDRMRRIKDYISTERYKTAVRQLKMEYMPIKWKIFLFCAKYKLTLPLYMLLVFIGYIKSKK